MSLFSFGKVLIEKKPGLIAPTSVVLRIISATRIKGRKNNIVDIGRAYLRHCRIIIHGSENMVRLGSGVSY